MALFKLWSKSSFGKIFSNFVLMLNHEGFRLHGIETATCSGRGSTEFSYEEMMMKLEVLPLNQHTFSAYGDVIETHKRDFSYQ